MFSEMKKNFLQFVVLMLFTGLAIGQTPQNAIVKGNIIEAKTNEPIPYANVVIMGTSMGSTTNLDGRYVIRNIPPGSYVVKASYIGYRSVTDSVQLESGEELRVDFTMKSIALKGKEVVLKGQASGQSQAVNREINSSQIVNYVSSSKIKELPDANAAESVGRLPGVSVLRSGGEGNKVVIRGLAPKYNKITIDGVEMESSNANNRSTDLSMISSNMLEGIEVKKTVTPDIDANVMGGVVNFEVREARVEEPGKPEYSFLAQGGYNNLPNAYKNKFNNFKFSGSIENRFLNNRLGIFAQVSAERKNLMSDKLGVWYTHYGNSRTKYIINSVSLTNTPRNKHRYNGALSLDYKWDDSNKIKFTNFFSTEITKNKRHTESYILGSNMINYWLYDSQDRLNSITNSLSVKKKIPFFDLDWSLSHSYSKRKTPDNWAAGFSQTSAGLSEFDQKENIKPKQVPKGADRDLSATHLRSFQNYTSTTKSRSLNTALDLKTDINITERIGAKIKFGGEFRHKSRSYEYEKYDTPQLLNSGSAQFVDNLINSHFGFPMNRTKISINRFIDEDLDYREFLDGEYNLYAPMDYDMLSEVSNLLQNNIDTIAASGNEGTYGRNNYSSTINDYSGTENHSAFYLMNTLNFYDYLTIISGVRYQDIQTNYNGIRGVTSPQSYWEYNHYDTTSSKYHGYWLPNIQIKLEPVSWGDVRLSYTNTLAYPDFADIIPKIDLSENRIVWNNVNLDPAESRNYDAYISVHSNTLGLFTAGAFLKHITDMEYSWTFYRKGEEVKQYLPRNLENFNPNATYKISTTKNNPYKNRIYGFELSWRSHFWYLPGPLSGLVLNVNYTHNKSKAKYPYVYSESTGRQIVHIDTSFTDRFVYQPDNILNLSLGFDYKDFSIRVALLYKDNIFTRPSHWPQLRGYTAPYKRWDIVASQKLTSGLEIYTNLNNVNGEVDKSVIQGGPPTSITDYGFVAQMGIRWRL